MAEVGAGRGHQHLGRLTVTSFNKWKDAIKTFNVHESTDYHKSCIAAADAFVVSNKQNLAALQLDKNRKSQIEENRRRIVPIVKNVLIFLGVRSWLFLVFLQFLIFVINIMYKLQFSLTFIHTIIMKCF